MKRTKLVLITAFMLAGPACSTMAASNLLEKQILKLQPQADKDGDGKLSEAEEAAPKKMILKRFPKTDKDGLLETASPMVKKRRHLATVIPAQNRAGLELPNVVTLFPGKLPIGDGVHYSSEGYIMLGKSTASAIEKFYQAKR